MPDITQGTWNNPLLPGIKLPDFGATEWLQDQYNKLTGNTGYNSVITNPNQRPVGLDYSNATPPAGTTGTTPISQIPNLTGTIKTPTTPTGAKANTGGGSGGSPSAPAAPDPAQIKRDNITKINTDKGADVALDYATNYADQMSPDQYYAMIDQEAGVSNKFLDEQEAAIRADQPGIESGLLDQYNTGLTSLQGGKNTAYGKTGLQRNQAGQIKEDAQSAARRLYSELQQGYRQRFGGASSAGEAAQALTQNEQQRVMAQNNRGYQNTLSSIGQSEAEIENTYNSNIAQLEQAKNQAINSAQSEFRNSLLQISQNRTAVESERLAARRQALQDLSQKVFAIQQQQVQFKQNIELMREQSRLQQAEALSSISGAANTGANALNNYNPSKNPTSNLTLGGNQTTASGNQGLTTIQNSIGNISSGITKNEDPLAKGVYPIMTMIDGRTKYSDGSIR